MSQFLFRNAFDSPHSEQALRVAAFCCYLANQPYSGHTQNHLKLEFQKFVLSMKDSNQLELKKRHDKRMNWDIFVIGTDLVIHTSYKVLHAGSSPETLIPCPDCKLLVGVLEGIQRRFRAFQRDGKWTNLPPF